MLLFDELLRKIKRKYPKMDTEQICKAYKYALEFYGKKQHPNGGLYIKHALSTAIILTDISEDMTLFIAAIFHNIIHVDASYLRQVKKYFGSEVSSLVESSSKFSHIQLAKNEDQFSSLQNMLLAMESDVRSVFIRLACRLHVMRNLEHYDQKKQEDFSYETLHVYAPIAHRLGMYIFKAPLEDLSFFYLKRGEYTELSRHMIKYELYRDKIVKHIVQLIQEIMKEKGVRGSVVGRIKHLYSIYSKLKQKRKDSVNDIYDIFAIRISVSTISDCYNVLGIIHENYLPMRNRFKDYIAVPKPNGYRSLHTTVFDLVPQTKHMFPIEVQIRTQEMNKEAEYGIAAHWRYKKKNIQKEGNHISQFSGIYSKRKKDASNEEKWMGISDVSSFDRVYVVTPTGEIKDLPRGACPIDFAFLLNPDIGLRVKMARVNGELVPLSYKLQNGDVVDILTRDDINPNESWVSLCVTSHAKYCIQKYFQKEKTGSSFSGKSVLHNSPIEGRNEGKGKSRIIIDGNQNISVKIALCCKPRAGDKIIGFVTRGNHVTIHKTDCSILSKLDPQRFLKAQYGYEMEGASRRVFFQVKRGADRVGFVHDILGIFSDFGANLVDFTFVHRSDFSATIHFIVDLRNMKHLERIISLVHEVKGVENIEKLRGTGQ
jgi:GTP pyrophosphokinase